MSLATINSEKAATFRRTAAALMAVSVVALGSATNAHAGGKNKNGLGAALAAGAIGVIAGGIIAANRPQPIYPQPVYPQPGYAPVYPPQYVPAPPPVVVVGGGNAHVAWCAQRYRSYQPYSNTFTGYDGLQHYCNSPYN